MSITPARVIGWALATIVGSFAVGAVIAVVMFIGSAIEAYSR